MNNQIIKVLMERDDLTVEEALEVLIEAQALVAEGEDPEEVLAELGLEPDYILDLLQDQ